MKCRDCGVRYHQFHFCKFRNSLEPLSDLIWYESVFQIQATLYGSNSLNREDFLMHNNKRKKEE